MPANEPDPKVQMQIAEQIGEGTMCRHDDPVERQHCLSPLPAVTSESGGVFRSAGSSRRSLSNASR
jgi:hypothetical protein